MNNFFKRLFAAKPAPALKQPSRPKRQYHESTIGLEDWQKDESLVSLAADVLADPRTAQMLSVLRAESPANYGLPPLGVSFEDRASFQARIEGYHLCLNNFEALGKLSVVPTESEPTFEAPEPEVE